MIETPIADAVATMISAEIPVETILAFIRSSETVLRQEAKTGAAALQKADKRRKWDRDRKRGNSTGRGRPIESSSFNDSHKLKVKEESKTPGSTGNPPEQKILSDWPHDYAKLFWDNCPRKVEKVEAMKCLDKVRRTGVAWSVFFAGVLRWSAASTGREKRYVKHPTTWLNKGCWTDEVEAAGSESNGNTGNYGQSNLGFSGIAATLRARAAAQGR